MSSAQNSLITHPPLIKNLQEYYAQVRDDSSKRMVELKSNINQLKYDLRYASTGNFMHRLMYPANTNVTFLVQPAATALQKVQQTLNKKGLGLKIFDAYRPWSVTLAFWELVKDERYVANPAKGSGHNRGVAVDLTIIDLKTGQELDMGTGFDNFTDSAHQSYRKLPKRVLKNRKLLRSAMEEYGFKALETEWWHYSLPDANHYPLLDIDFEKLGQSILADSNAVLTENSIHGLPEDVQIEIDNPVRFHKNASTYLVLYALPNGNSIEWTKGRRLHEADDWHFDIQHIKAQTRFVRQLDSRNNYIIIYLANQQKSWPAWKRAHPDANLTIRRIVDSVRSAFHSLDPHIVLNGHSGGGSFIFGYLDAMDSIPSFIDRIAFLDSDYGYDTPLHQNKITGWLKRNKKNHLIVLAYNDSVVIYNGKPLVSPTGGTWYRSRQMQRDLAATFKFSTYSDTAFIRHSGLKGRISIILKKNPSGLIYHTVQVERNGFIYSLLANTIYDRKKYFTYFGERAYTEFIE